jgi:hypothetical protein
MRDSAVRALGDRVDSVAMAFERLQAVAAARVSDPDRPKNLKGNWLRESAV